MDNDRTALIIIGGLGLAFAIAIFERLQRPLGPVGGMAAEGQVASIIYAIAALFLVGGFVFAWRRNNPGDWLRSAAIWTVIIAGAALVLAFLTGNWTSPSTTLSP